MTRIKLILAAAGGVVLLALLMVSWSGARERGMLHHCRNNLRRLGFIAINNQAFLDPELRGVAFWNQVRELQYKTLKGDWLPMDPDPFICPVYGKTKSDREDPKAIDYLGPGYDPTKLVSGRPIGGDRERNHSPGYVVLYDTTVREDEPRRVDVKEPGHRKWLQD